MSRRRKALIVVGLILCATVLIPCLHHWQLRGAANACIAELKAKGEPLDLAQAIPPPTPPEQNAAPLITNVLYGRDYQSVAATNPPSAKSMIAPGKAMVAWQQPEIREIHWATNSWEELGQALTNYDGQARQLRILFERPLLDFNLDYNQGASLSLRHLVELKWVSVLLSGSAIYKLRQGFLSEACMDTRTILAIAKGQTDERLEISQRVRLGITQIAADTTWEILQHPKLSDSDLAGLQADWQSLEFIAPLEHALLVDRIFRLQSFEKARESPISDIFHSMENSPWGAAQWRWFWSYRDEVRGLRAFQALIDATRMAETNSSFLPIISLVHTNFNRLGLKISDPDGIRIDFDPSELPFLFSLSVSGSFNTLRKAMNVQIALNSVIAAIALKRYEIRHQKLPATLDELKPDFVSSVPSDPMDGQPLRYRRNPDGTFLLYSIGEDGIDDGGNPVQKDPRMSPSWLNSRDCVWPSPATEEEIHAYELKASARHY